MVSQGFIPRLSPVLIIWIFNLNTNCGTTGDSNVKVDSSLVRIPWGKRHLVFCVDRKCKTKYYYWDNEWTPDVRTRAVVIYHY